MRRWKRQESKKADCSAGEAPTVGKTVRGPRVGGNRWGGMERYERQKGRDRGRGQLPAGRCAFLGRPGFNVRSRPVGEGRVILQRRTMRACATSLQDSRFDAPTTAAAAIGPPGGAGQRRGCSARSAKSMMRLQRAGRSKVASRRLPQSGDGSDSLRQGIGRSPKRVKVANRRTNEFTKRIRDPAGGWRGGVEREKEKTGRKE